MEWKRLLNLENFSVRNSFARILYSTAPIATATFLAYQQQQYSGDANKDLVSALTTAGVLITPFASVAGNTLAEAISDKFFKNYRRRDILENGDLQKAVGDAICATILQIYQAKDSSVNQKVLGKLSKIPNKVWEDLIIELEKEKDDYFNLSLEEIDKLMPRNLPDIFAVKATDFNKALLIDRNTWGKILRKLCFLRGISTSNEDYPNFTDTIEAAAIKLEEEFPEILKHTIISNVTDNHKAYANLQLKITGEILYFVRESDKKSDEILAIVRRLEERNAQLEALYSSEKFNPDRKFLADAYNLEKDIFEIVLDTQSRVKAIEQNTKEILELLKEGKILKSSAQKFYPKNFPERLIYFTGRETVLEKIEEALNLKGTAALADTHGVGKSSVVTEFAYRHQDSFKHILFIRATNNEFDIYVSDLLKDLGISLPNDAKPADNLAALQEWLAKNDEWLLLVDNVDEVEFIKECKFNKATGKVIYTSNNDKIYKVGTAVDIPRMSDENAMLLLYKHWQDKAEATFAEIPEKYHSTLKEIAADFGNHPFSMAFVGSYLADEDESLEDFLKVYQKKEKNLLANYEFLSSYQHKSVATAFLLRFEQISMPKDESDKEKFLAIAVKDYLKLSAYIATDNIPEEFLQQSLTKLHPEQKDLTNDEEFIKEIYKRFKPTSIFKRNGEDKLLTTHRIVQEIMRFQIKEEEEVLLQTIADVLFDNFEAFDFTNKEKVEKYLSHVGVFIEYLEETKPNETSILRIENKSTARLCNNYARYFQHYGEYRKAEKYYEYNKEICERNETIEETERATSYNNLALLYRSQGRYEEAEEYYLKSLAICEKVLGEEHPDTATSYNNLAGLYYSQGRYEEAEEYYLKALAIREKVLGEEHPDIATSYNNLGNLYYSQGKYEEAEAYYLKDLAINEKVLGEEHPDTGISYDNLGLLYKSQGRYEEAEPYYLKALAILEEVLGKKHPETAITYNNLAALYESQGKYKEAEEYHLKALAIREKVLGAEHPHTANSYNNLGVFYANQGKFKEAKNFLVKALTIRLNKLGDNHPNTIRTTESLQYVEKMMQDSEK